MGAGKGGGLGGCFITTPGAFLRAALPRCAAAIVVAAFASGELVAMRAGAALLVARRDRTRAPELASLSTALTGAGVQVIGSTLNHY